MEGYFSDYHEAGVAARVAMQLVRQQYNRAGGSRFSPNELITACLTDLGGIGLPMVRMALHSLGVWVSQGKRSSEWLRGVLYRDLMGYTFRRCFFAAYKENRRLYPRVTNRGVQASFLAPLSPTDEGYELGFSTHSAD